MILVTHIDLDGAGCELVARWFYPELSSEQIIHCDYDTIDTVVENALSTTSENMIVADVSFSKSMAEKIHACYPGRVQLVDHHQTVLAYLSQYPWAILDTSICGTKLLFRTLRSCMESIEIPEKLENFVYYVNDYDMWIHQSPMSQKLNDLHHLLGMKLFVDIMLERIRAKEPLVNQSDELYLKGLAATKKKYFDECLKKALVVGNRLVIQASRHTSEFAQYIRDINPPPAEWKDVDYVDFINLELWNHSLRSYRPGFDVRKVAEEHGGGGHKAASGYRIPYRDPSWILEF